LGFACEHKIPRFENDRRGSTQLHLSVCLRGNQPLKSFSRAHRG
jgi:hypothetical protein